MNHSRNYITHDPPEDETVLPEGNGEYPAKPPKIPNFVFTTIEFCLYLCLLAIVITCSFALLVGLGWCARNLWEFYYSSVAS